MPLTQLIQFLNSVSGHFAFVIQDKDFLLCAVDPSGSCNLIWRQDQSRVWISDNINNLVKHLKFNERKVCPEAALSMAMSGYTVGTKTIYKSIYLLEPGQYLLAESKMLKVSNYYDWVPAESVDSQDQLSEEVINLHDLIIRRLIARANGDQIVVPLSAGLDSRLIASGLAHFKYDNVLCVSYGRRQNRETETAVQIAACLGFRHIEIPYTNKLVRKSWQSDDYKAYLNYCDVGASVHFFGEYMMIKHLVKNGEIDKKTIFANGQSGDFITGNHIPQSFSHRRYEQEPDDIRFERILTSLCSKHYSLWKCLETDANLARIKNLLQEQIIELGGMPNLQKNDFGIYEAVEFVNRQSKYVLNGVKTYEYFGNRWAIPLWDREVMDFWRSVPLSQKMNQNLYRETLIEQNWGGVWQSIPINPSAKFSLPVRCLRLIAKAPFFYAWKSRMA